MLNSKPLRETAGPARRLALIRDTAPQAGASFSRPARFAIAAGWLGLAIAISLSTGHTLAGICLTAAVVATELRAAGDAYGSKALSGLLSVLAVLLIGWPGGVVIGVGAVALGDIMLRNEPARRAAWWAGLLALLLTAGAWTVGVAGTVASGPWAPRSVAAASFAVFAVWTARRVVYHSGLALVAIGAMILAVIGAALTGTAWMPLLPSRLLPWAGAGMMGLGLIAAFMLCDLVVASVAAWRASGPEALAFWDEHLPVLFLRYASQGIAAGLIAHGYVVGSAGALAGLLVGVVIAQSIYLAHRRAEATIESAVAALASAIDARDPYTAGHSTRVAEYAGRVALSLGWSKAKVERIRKAGLLHDVGKLGVTDDVLHKSGKLTHSEFEHMKRHATVGAAIVAQVQGLSRIAAIVGQDHERWSGGGYPEGRAGKQILPEARLIAIADVYDAMTTTRPYRQALPEDDVLRHLEREAGRQFDPVLSEAFIRVVRDNNAAGVLFCYCATH